MNQTFHPRHGVAFRRGSAPEVIDDGESGFLVDDVDGAVAAVSRLPAFDRARARAAFNRRFTIERVARDYLDIYRALPGVRRARRAAEARPAALLARAFGESILHKSPPLPPTLQRLAPPNAAPTE